MKALASPIGVDTYNDCSLISSESNPDAGMFYVPFIVCFSALSVFPAEVGAVESFLLGLVANDLVLFVVNRFLISNGDISNN